jgi:hypothetical protein
MASELISFRLSNSELDWLKDNCEDGESLNLAAKRLLLSLSQGVNSRVNSVDNSVNSVDTPNIREELEQLQFNLDERLAEIEERLGKLKA